MEKIDILIVGGCLSMQDKLHGSISENELFHEIIKKQIDAAGKIDVNIRSIHYERFSVCYEKVFKANKSSRPDILIFQVRGNHYVKLVKLIGRYVNQHDKWKWTVNLPRRKNKFEEYPVKLQESHTPVSIQKTVTKTKFFKHLVANSSLEWIHRLNYFFGTLIGNAVQAKKSYSELIKQIVMLSKKNKIPVILLGVTARPFSEVQNYHSGKLNDYMRKFAKSQKLVYVDIFDTKNKYGEYKFAADDLHLNATGHREIAEKLMPFILQLLPINTTRTS